MWAQRNATTETNKKTPHQQHKTNVRKKQTKNNNLQANKTIMSKNNTGRCSSLAQLICDLKLILHSAFNLEGHIKARQLNKS